MKFLVKTPGPKDVVLVSVEQDGDDVNIYATGHDGERVLVAWFAPSSRGKARLRLSYLGETEAEILGLEIDDENHVCVGND